MSRFALLCVAILFGGVAHAEVSSRSAQLVNSFQVFCTLELPNFASLEAKATAMKLPVLQQLGESKQEGYFARSKGWGVGLASGRHELATSEARGPNGSFATCGIAASDGHALEVRRELVKAMKLGDPLSEEVSAHKLRTTTWRQNWKSAEVKILLTDRTPLKLPGVYLTVVHQTERPGK